MDKQLELFESSLNCAPRLKEALREAIKSSRYSREEIADRMNAICGRDGIGAGRAEKITAVMIDAWTAESKNHLPPVQLLPVFCRAADNQLPIKVLAATIGATVVGEDEIRLLAWAKAEAENRKNRKMMKRLAMEAGLE